MLQRLISSRKPIPHRIAVWLAAIVLLACAWSPCQAESPYLIDVWTPYQGLPQSRVTSIVQTQDGYLWIATQRGWLARFDGIHFKPYSSDNTPALGSPEIQKLFVDEAGVLWISDDRFAVINQGKHNRLRRFARYIKREGKKVNSPKQLLIFIKKISSLILRKVLGRG